MKHHLVALLTTAAFNASLNMAEAQPVESSYAPWNVDEFQLIGKSADDIASSFQNELQFSPDNRYAWLRGDRNGPQFHLTYTDGKVCSIQRVFVDGGGCAISGPILRTKTAALEYFIDGMSSIPARTATENRKLNLARTTLTQLAPIRLQ